MHFNGRAAAVGTAAALALGAAVPVSAADDAGALETMLGRDSEVTLQLRTYAMDRHKPGPVLNQAWAAGGWLGYQSGWLADAFRFGLVGYTSQPLWAPPDASGTLLLTSTQDGYSVLGQAYASLKLADQVLTGGRFGVSQPEIHHTDNRMTPDTYEGGNLAGAVLGVDYFVGYLTGEKQRNATTFVNFATIAGAPADVSSPMWLFGLRGEPVKGLEWRLSSYHVPNIIDSTYADVSWLTPLSDDTRLRLGAQAMVQSSTGSDALTGTSFSTGVGGVRADLTRGGVTGTLAYTQTARGAAYRTPYSGWAGYTSMIYQDFDQAGQKGYLVGGTLDFTGLDVPGMVLNGAIVFGRDAINPSTRAALPDLTEYDLTLDYRFTAATWPAWARPLWIRARAAVLTQSVGGTTTDYRVIVNYPLTFK